ncbi:hypothetical protein JTB14_006646 [Gonioctena quinquepunctata]|nr:hypothetical protein JTB14_006646 [Gonioctena quinquepunctata]
MFFFKYIQYESFSNVFIFLAHVRASERKFDIASKEGSFSLPTAPSSLAARRTEMPIGGSCVTEYAAVDLEQPAAPSNQYGSSRSAVT